jgi:hypothetical protein
MQLAGRTGGNADANRHRCFTQTAFPILAATGLDLIGSRVAVFRTSVPET